MELRDYQSETIYKLKVSLSTGHKRPCVQAPTGAGKTVIAAAIIKMARDKDKRVMFVVPMLSLIDQTVDRFVQNGINEIGVMQGQHEMTDPNQPVQVCSMQTLMRRELPDVDLVIIDEAHVQFKFMREWAAWQHWSHIPFIGLTATPWAKAMGKVWDDLIIATTTGELIKKGVLSDFKVFAPAHPDLQGVKTVRGDYDEKQLAEAMDKGSLVADIVSTWLEKGENRPTICFAVNRVHAKHIQQQFEAAGVEAEYMDAFTPVMERNAIIKRFANNDIKVICNVGVLTTGFDADVRCIILARPTKSEILYTQMIGRGLRTATGKDHCIAKGTKILTNKGEVNIEDVTLDHLVWDGVSFVKHGGAVCKGKQPVIEYLGLTATSDHKVMTNEGWKSFEEASCRRLWIAVTGSSGEEIRFNDNNFSENFWIIVSPEGGSRVRTMQENAHGFLSQFEKETGYKILSSLQWKKKNFSSEMVVSTLSIAARQMQQSIIGSIQKLWGAGNKIFISISQRCRNVDRRKSWCSIVKDAIRPYKQQWSLRAWEFALDGQSCEHEQYTTESRIKKKIYSIQKKISGNKICRQNFETVNFNGIDGQRNNTKMGIPIVQTEREVWDIYNAGPLQRFTANGLLVHNCLILDHSDTTIRLGFVTDIHHETLDDGKPKKNEPSVRKEALPKECPKCSFVKAPKVRTCPACGFEAAPVNKVESMDGELYELTRDKKIKSKDWPISVKQEWYSQLILHAQLRGYKRGWAYHAYRNKFGVGPANTLFETPADQLTPEVQSWIRHYNIAKAKMREKLDKKNERSRQNYSAG